MALPVTNETDVEYLAAVRVLELNPNTGKKNPERFKLLSIAEVEKIPPPTFLVAGIIPDASACTIYGPPGGGKTFLALDLALSVASGVSFFGHACKQGNVVYVIGEGQSGMGARIRSWKAARQMYGSPMFWVVPEPVQLLQPHDVELFVDAIIDALEDPPVLIVLDTLARCFLGGEENSARDMGMAVATVDALRRRTGAAVLLVHHTRKDGDAERGSVALRGGMDAMLSLKGEDGRMLLHSDKQKDARDFADIALQLTKSGDSMVFALPGQRLGPSRTALAMLEVLSRDFPSDPPTLTEWMAAAGVADRTFYRARGELITAGYLAEKKTGRSKHYSATPDGLIAVALAGKNDAENASSRADNCHDCQTTANPDLAVIPGSQDAGGLGGNPPFKGGSTPASDPDERGAHYSDIGVVKALLPLLPTENAGFLAVIDGSPDDLRDEILERQAIRLEHLGDSPPPPDDADYGEDES